MNAPARLRIDFVSDIACPWCAIGLASLREALANLGNEVQADIHLQPFELEPRMPAAGADAAEHLAQKYGLDAARVEANRDAIRERAAAVGVDIHYVPGQRVWNTFDAHRLLHWAGLQDPARAITLKQALFHAYFAKHENVGDHEVLARLADEVGLDVDAARRVLADGRYAEEVRAQERRYQQAGINSVPATIINGTQLIPGGQPPDVFEHALRQIAGTGSA